MKYKKGTPCPQRKNRHSQVGNKNANWKGGRFHSSNGYIWTYTPDHPNASKVSPKGYILEHRLVMEKKIGRYLTKKEVVHHINSVRDDNSLENLVLTTNSDNIAISNSQRPLTEQCRYKRRENAEKLSRDKNGRFVKKL